MQKLIIAGALCLMLFGSAADYAKGATRHDSINVTCDDGRKLRYNPFNNTKTPEELCGEVKAPSESDVYDNEFVQVYGERPSTDDGLTVREMRRARFLWARNKQRFGGVVTVEDVLDPDNHSNPDALKEALKADELGPEHFNEVKMEELRRAYIYYGIGEFGFYLTRMTYADPNSPNTPQLITTYRLRTYYPSMPGYFNSGVNTVKYPTLPVAQGQVELSNRGVCAENRISLLQSVELKACMSDRE